MSNLQSFDDLVGFSLLDISADSIHLNEYLGN